MEPLDKEKDNRDPEIPSYRTAYSVILLLQVITLISIVQHWPFATLMKYSSTSVALGFGIHRMILFKLSLAQKGLLVLILIYPLLYLVVIFERVIDGLALYNGLYFFLGISCVSFILFSLYTEIARRRQKE